MDIEPLLVGQSLPGITESQYERNHELPSTIEIMRLNCLYYLSLVTVEPSMFLYILAFMLTSVVEQAFFIFKACTVDVGLSKELCLNLTSHKEENKKVQIIVSTFHQNNDIASHVTPIFLALFMGAWSDRRGRKLLLLLGLFGKLWYSIWIVINSLQDTWPLNNVIWTASFPCGFTGADLAIFAASFAYISDITSPENRTLRLIALDVTYLGSIPLGVAIGKYLFSYFNCSYAIMFSINAFLLVMAFIYSFMRLDWATTCYQKPLNLCCLKVTNKFDGSENCIEESQPNFLVDFFDKTHLKNSIKAITKWRPHYGRTYIVIIIISMGLYTFQRDERQMSYLYTNLKFKWDVNKFSDFRIFQSTIYVLGTLLCIPLMGKYFKLSDTTMIMVGTISHASARVVFALAQEPWQFYLGAGIASVGPIVAPVLKSMASKIVPVDEKGMIFAVLSVADTAVPLFSGIVYSQVYNATIHSYPNAIFWVTVATQLTIFTFILAIKLVSKNRPLEMCGAKTH